MESSSLQQCGKYICPLVPGISAPANSAVGQHSIRDNDMDSRHCHVMAFPPGSMLGLAQQHSHRARMSERDGGAEQERGKVAIPAGICD